MRMWMSTKLCVGLFGSIINPVSLNRRQSRNMPRKTVVPRKPQQSFWHWPNKIEAVFRFIRPFRMRTAKKPARMSAGITIGTMRRFYGTASRLKLSEKRLNS